MTDVLALTRELIAKQSVTPDDAGCMELISDRLAKAGCHIQRLGFRPSAKSVCDARAGLAGAVVPRPHRCCSAGRYCGLAIASILAGNPGWVSCMAVARLT